MGMSGGGGAGSGKVDYPTYLKKVHFDWLADNTDPDGAPTDTIEASMTEVMNDALGASPFSGLSAYDPDAALLAMDMQIVDLFAHNFATSMASYDNKVISSGETPIALLTDFAAFLAEVKSQIDTEIYSTTEVDADIDAFGDLIDAQIEAKVLPRFRRGMQDINAVQSSAFVVGAALIEEARNKEVVKYGTGLRVENYKARNQQIVQATLALLTTKLQALTQDFDSAYRATVSELDFQKALATILHDVTRTKVITKKEQKEQEIDLEEKDAKWDLEVFSHGANLLAAVHGGTAQLVPKQNKFMSALGGALSGAAMGAQVGGPAGAGIGGMLGLIGGLF